MSNSHEVVLSVAHRNANRPGGRSSSGSNNNNNNVRNLNVPGLRYVGEYKDTKGWTVSIYRYKGCL